MAYSLSMNVIKRNGRKEAVSFDKVLERVQRAAEGLSTNPTAIAQKVLAQIYDGVKTSELDELTSQLAASLSTLHPDYGTLAARITISNHHKNTEQSFAKVMKTLGTQLVPKTGEKVAYISQEILDLVDAHGALIESVLSHDRDYLLDYFGFKTMEKSYLLKDSSGTILERPQHLWMRVSLALWGSKDLNKAFETYDLMSQKFFTHATPTLFNAGTPRQQLSSCFLLAMADDSISGIYKTLTDCALISKHAGGIGIHCHNVRAKGSLIRGTNGMSNGLVPMLRVFNNTARYVDQCFTPDTIVIIEKNGINQKEKICNVKEGDNILTTLGNRKVVKTVTHWISGPMKLLKTNEHIVSVCVTDSHPILAIKRASRTLEETKKAITVGLVAPEYIEVKDLSLGDFIIGNNEWNTLESIEDTTYTGVVHDFEIENPHDYYIHGLGFAHNGGGKRNGSFAMYLEPWHADVEDFLKLKLGTGSEEERARDLFYALWIPDLFMKRVEEDGDWTLFCPSEAPGLADVHSEAFEALYTKYESEKKGRKTVKAQKLWFQIMDSQMETGTPYLVYKDAANSKSNQKNLGTIKSSNLCSEIIEYSDKDESAVCNLASIGLPAFVNQETLTFDFNKLRKVVAIATVNLNRVIDINYYPTPETKRSNMRHRPIGLGIQGLADVFALLRLPWDSPEAANLNQRIFEHMYYAAVEASANVAIEEGPYETYQGSPASQGKLQPDLWGVRPLTASDKTLDWPQLYAQVAKHGLRNSLLMAPMPTASTSQILGYNECFEPFTTNIYTRRTLAGEYIMINKYLLKDLLTRNIWSETLKQKIIAQNGSVQGISEIPAALQDLYRTSWELKQRSLIDLAAARGAFICQSQSLNLFVSDPSYAKLTSMHFYAWKKGLKTGCYYLRTKAAVTAQKFTVDPKFISTTAQQLEEEHSDEEAPIPLPTNETRKEKLDRLAREFETSLADAKDDGCTMCGS